MKVYAVIDTNVLVSALFTKHPDTAPAQILERLFDREIIPMYNDEILAEYNEVLRRPKFPFPEDAIVWAINAIIEAGIDSERVPVEETATDPKDVVFLEVAMSREDSFLVTGNTKHFPIIPRVVTPKEFLDILKALDNDIHFFDALPANRNSYGGNTLAYLENLEEPEDD